MPTVLDQASSLLDFSQKLDISLLDNVINSMYTGHGETVGKIQKEHKFKQDKKNSFYFFKAKASR